MSTRLKNLIKLIVPSLLVIVLALVVVIPAFADVIFVADTAKVPDCTVAGATAAASSNAGETVRVYAEAGIGGLAFARAQATTVNGLASVFAAVNDDPNAIASAIGDIKSEFKATYGGPADGTCYGIALVYVNGELVQCDTSGDVSCPGGGYNPEPPPGIWSAAVCEPFDGFSGDGWSTFGTDANDKPYGSTLYVAAGPDGPWFETGFLQSPYVISHEHMDALTAMVGLTDYHEMWFRPGEYGIAANVGSMITDREGDLPALCGTE